MIIEVLISIHNNFDKIENSTKCSKTLMGPSLFYKPLSTIFSEPKATTRRFFQTNNLRTVVCKYSFWFKHKLLFMFYFQKMNFVLFLAWFLTWHCSNCFGEYGENESPRETVQEYDKFENTISQQLRWIVKAISGNRFLEMKNKENFCISIKYK